MRLGFPSCEIITGFVALFTCLFLARVAYKILILRKVGQIFLCLGDVLLLLR